MAFTGMVATCNLESFGLSVCTDFPLVLESYTNTHVCDVTPIYLNIPELILCNCEFIAPGHIIGKHLDCRSKVTSVTKLSNILG